jgi:hypothetical protein
LGHLPLPAGCGVCIHDTDIAAGKELEWSSNPLLKVELRRLACRWSNLLGSSSRAGLEYKAKFRIKWGHNDSILLQQVQNRMVDFQNGAGALEI